MNVDNIILKYIDNLSCDICNTALQENIVGVSCCDKVYHRSCIQNNNSLTCPKCQKMYVIQDDKPLLNRLMFNIPHVVSVIDLYQKIYRKNPEDLHALDCAFFKNQISSQYCNKFLGYFDYSLFNKKFSNDSLDQKWDEFSYGILTGYNWKYTYWTGKELYEIIHLGTTKSEHITLCIFNSDYRKVRQQLDCLLTCIENNISDKCFINIEEGLIIVNVRGITKKICIHIEYLDKPFWFIFGKKQKYIPSYGSLYTCRKVTECQHVLDEADTENAPRFCKKGTVLLTIKSMLQKYDSKNSSASNKLAPLQSLSKPLGYDVDTKIFSRKINSGIISKKILLENIYCQYDLHVETGENLNNIKKELLNKIYSSDLKNTINIFHKTTKNDNILFRLVNKHETINFSDSIITAKKVIDFVLKRVYRQHVMLLPLS
jgi:hypothetical protein